MSYTSELVNHAVRYAGRGWHVFPIYEALPDAACACGDPHDGSTKGRNPGNIGKHPRCWRGLSDATTDEARIRGWWTEWPEASVGIRTGAISNLDVLDIDPRHGGDTSLAVLEAQHGPLETPCEVLTGGGGRQLYYAHTEGIRNTAGVIDAGLDTRADGGYVVAAPSLHKSGRRYEIDPSSNLSAVLLPFPQWLIDRIKTGSATKAEARKAPGWADGLLEGVPEGSRDQDCVRLIGRYVSMRPPLSENEVLAFMLTWAEKCRPPFPEELVQEKVERFFASMQTDLLDFPLTDAGNAERMVALFGDQFRWVTDREAWLAWDGGRWAPGRADLVKVYALDTARASRPLPSG